MHVLRQTLPITLALFGSLLLTLTHTPIAHADTITVIPPKFEIFGNPGDTISERIKVRNDGQNDITYQTEVEDFQAVGDLGGVDLIDDPHAPTTSFSLSKWVTVEPTRFTVQAGQEKVISYSIRIPRNAEPGGKYASILVKLGGKPVSGGASVESKVGSLLLLRVSGNVKEQLKVESFNTDTNFSQYGPINFNLKTKNDGNVHVAPTGTIVITDIFGKKVKEIPLKSTNVLPNASRLVKTTWEDKNLIGKYTATLVATYGQQKQTITTTTTFIVFPLILLWVLIAVVVMIILLITQRKKLKRLINKLTSD